MILEIAIVAVLIALNAFFALSEMAVVTARKPRLRQLAMHSAHARRAYRLAEHPERLLSSVQVGITLIGVLTGVVGGASFGQRFGLALAPWIADPEFARTVGVALSVVIITFFTILFGELVPKRIALLAPERIAVRVATPIDILSRVAMPVVSLLSACTRLLLRLFRADRVRPQRVSEEEIRLLVAEGHEQGVIDVDERNMMNRVLRLGDRTAESLMVPRVKIAFLDIDADLEENLDVLASTPFSRYPVYRGGDDEVVGIFEVKTLSTQVGHDAPTLFDALREPLFISESTKALDLLQIFRDEKMSVGLVVDEYGGLLGLVTQNDVLSAVFGRLPQMAGGVPDPEAHVFQREDGSYLVDGSLSVEDLRELLSVSSLPGEDAFDYHTVAGMVVLNFGRIPGVGEHLEHGDWRFEVIDLDGPRIDKLLLARRAPANAHVAPDG